MEFTEKRKNGMTDSILNGTNEPIIVKDPVCIKTMINEEIKFMLALIIVYKHSLCDMKGLCPSQGSN